MVVLNGKKEKNTEKIKKTRLRNVNPINGQNRSFGRGEFDESFALKRNVRRIRASI